MTDEIYVQLQDEGVDVWRPAPAWKIGPNAYIVLRPDDYDPAVETWQFPPGTVVETEQRQLSGGQALVAVRPSETNRQTA